MAASRPNSGAHRHTYGPPSQPAVQAKVHGTLPTADQSSHQAQQLHTRSEALKDLVGQSRATRLNGYLIPEGHRKDVRIAHHPAKRLVSGGRSPVDAVPVPLPRIQMRNVPDETQEDVSGRPRSAASFSEASPEAEVFHPVEKTHHASMSDGSTFKSLLLDFLIRRREEAGVPHSKNLSIPSSILPMPQQVLERQLGHIDDNYVPKKSFTERYLEDQPALDGKAVARFYAYFTESIREHTEGDLEPEWTNAILNMLPQSLVCQFPPESRALFTETREDFLESNKTAAVSFILRSPLEGQNPTSAPLEPDTFGNETEDARAARRERFAKARRALTAHLHLLRPSMQKLLALGDTYKDMRLFGHMSTSVAHGSNARHGPPLSEAIRISAFRSSLLVQSEKSKELITKTWMMAAGKILAREAEAAAADNETLPLNFYLTGQALLKASIYNIMDASLKDICQTLILPTNEDGQVEGPSHLLVRLYLKKDKIEFDPPLSDVMELVAESLDYLQRTISNIPSLELLYHNPKLRYEMATSDKEVDFAQLKLLGLTSNCEFSVLLNAHEIEEARVRMTASVTQAWKQLMEYLNRYDAYSPLLTLHTELLPAMKQMLEVNPNFWQCSQEIEKYRKIASSITMDNPARQSLPLFELHLDELNRNFVTRAQEVANLAIQFIVQRQITDHQEICASYQRIADVALAVPDNFKEMADQMAFMDQAREVDLPALQERLDASRSILLYLMGATFLSKDHLAINNQAFGWPTRIIPILEQNCAIFGEAKEKSAVTLRQRRNEFELELEQFTKQIAEFEQVGDLEDMPFYIKKVQTLTKQLQSAQDTVAAFNREEKLFGWQVSVYPQRKQLLSALEPYQALYNMATNFQKSFKRWMDGPLLELESDQIEEEIDSLKREIFRLLGSMGKENPSKNIVRQVQERLEEFLQNVPVIQVMCNPGLRDRHWERMSAIVGIELKPDATTTLRRMLKNNIHPHLPLFREISDMASKEFTIEKNLNKMIADWQPLTFAPIPYRDSDTFVLASVDEIQLLLDDHIVKVQSMRGSPYIKPLESQVKEFEQRLLMSQEIVDAWLKVQSTWLYLEPIFSSEDILVQMPEEGRMFKSVDSSWKTLMRAVDAQSAVMAVTAMPNLLDELNKDNQYLELIIKGLNSYLEVKRLFFPRFFFLSNDEMLEILSETKDPTRVEPHLKKCFEGINRLEFDPEMNILALISSEKERLPLTETISTADARGSVERWLLQVEQGMMASVQHTIGQAATAYTSKPRREWVLDWPGQAVLCVAQILWTLRAEEAIARGPAATKKFFQVLNDELNEIIELVRGQPSKMARLTLGALVVLDVHARDVIGDLCAKQLSSVSEFSWQSQLRYYLDPENPTNGDVTVRMINAEKRYGYEYLGNSSRLVITPLTDRCYRTLFGALQLNLGGAPEGPAGTGKTETTKDLAKALAKQCVVYNCSDGLDYLAMGKFFKGLASAGAWACFDEFNRIDLEVLSVTAQQILTIQRAIAASAIEFNFEGTTLRLNPTCAVFITMNPGYAGRSELPDNLKALFRTVAMMVPDYTLIGEITLYSFGFVQARMLARKITATYRLCSEQLSSQDHYDYGMRAVKSVLTAAGNLKLMYPTEQEDILVLRSIMDVNLPKFLSQDIELFRGIASDLFPGITLPKPDYDELIYAIEDACRHYKLQIVAPFVEKVIQLYEMMLVRHGFMLVGEPFSGKTSAYKVLAKALNELYAQSQSTKHGWLPVQYRVINPKSITMGQLYGEFDPVSHEWTDGVIATTFRYFASSTLPDRYWVLLDGPVDAIWIENMNTVLDDNKKLCLMSGEIIQLSNTMSLVFEVADLAVASPATVSRCGMIYMEPERLGWRPLFTSWLNEQSALVNIKDWVAALFTTFVPKLLAFVKSDSCVELSLTTPIGLVNALMNLLAGHNGIFEVYKNHDVQLKTAFYGLFVFSTLWSIGGCLDLTSQDKFDHHFRVLIESQSEQLVLLPQDGSLYDYQLHVRTEDIQSGEDLCLWSLWTNAITDFQIAPDAEFRDIVVPTKDTARYKYLIDVLIKAQVATMLIGPTGTGKSKYIMDKLLNELDTSTFQPLFVNFSARTRSSQVQDLLMSKFEKRRKGVYGAPTNKKYVVFVDDVNVVQKEVYGAQPPIELFRQLLDHGNWYDKKDTTRLEIVDVQLIAAAGPMLTGSQNIVTSRFLRHFNQIAINSFNQRTLGEIFSMILKWQFCERFDFTEKVKRFATKALAPACTRIFQWALSNLLPTPAKMHYTFNLRDYSRVVQGICRALPEHVSEPAHLISLWTHETARIYYDRLTNDTDREMLIKAMEDTAFEVLHADKHDVFTSLKNPDGKLTGETLRGLLYTDVLSASDDRVSRGTQPAAGDHDDEPGSDVPTISRSNEYIQIKHYHALHALIESSLNEYNLIQKTKMNLVLFRFAVEHVLKICRILKLQGGHALLVGVGGSGRQSLTRLACFLCDMDVFQIELSKNYSIADWREDLKKLLMIAGCDARPVTFLFPDVHIKSESFLEDVNSLLNSGDVPNLYAPDEFQAILEKVGAAANEAAAQAAAQGGEEIQMSSMMLYSFFVERVKRNLHIVLCMSPVGSAFRNRLRQFGAVVNCCTIDWFQAWPGDALQAVAQQSLRDVSLNAQLEEKVVHMCRYFHTTVQELSTRFAAHARRYNYVTPTSYLGLLESYKNLLSIKRNEILAIQRRYQSGLSKLEFAAKQVMQMQSDLTNLQPQLVRTQQETADMLIRIERESVEVEATRTNVSAEEAIAMSKAKEAKAIKDDCEAQLAEALPLLRSALAALDTLKKQDIDLVKSMKNPPDGVKLVMEAVCVMKDIKPDKIPDPSGSGKMINDYWKTSLKMLSDPRFLDSLKAFDKDNIPPHVVKKIRTSFMTNSEFKPEKVRNASSAAEGLCSWILAMEAYDRVAKVVAPKQVALGQAEAELSVTMTSLNEKQAVLKAVEDRLASLNAELQGLADKKVRLEGEVKSCEEQLDRAQKLMGGLGGEKSRWTIIVQDMEMALVDLPGNILIASGVIAYLGAFSKTYRQECTTDWIQECRRVGIPCSEKFTLSSILGDPIQIRDWAIYGMPSDNFSIDNGIIIKNSRQWPLMIDPQGQANRWIKQMEASNNLQVIKLTDSDYIRTLENAITFGQPVLLENVKEELDPVLDSVLGKQIFKSGGVNCIRLGDAIVEYSDNFRLYITTKLRNPHYLPEISTKVTLLNFMIIQEGLEDQLLGIVVSKERPELQDEKNQLIMQSAENKKRLKSIEDRILEILSSSEGNILENETAIQVLSSSKLLSVELSEKQKVAEETEKKIDETRESYRPIAEFASSVFFMVADLAQIDSMYQFSLGWFVDLYVNAITHSTKSSVVTRRLKNLENHFTFLFYSNVCRSLFERDKLLFAFQLCTTVLRTRNLIKLPDLNFLVNGAAGMPPVADGPHIGPRPEDATLFTDRVWQELMLLTAVSPDWKDILRHIKLSEWQAFAEAEDLFNAPLPKTGCSHLDELQKLVLIRVLKPQSLIPAVQEFIKLKMSQKFIEPPPFDLAASFEDSSHYAPLVFVLSPGMDPMAQLLKFADDSGIGSSRVFSISLGQGQGPIAAQMISEAQAKGDWVVLQNCHLATSWLSSLEKIVDDMLTASNNPLDKTINPSFRLWLTSYPSPSFPMSVLQRAIKMTNEPPRGLRANILKTYLTDPISSPEFFSSLAAGPPEAQPEVKQDIFEKLLFSLCTFHAVVQERRQFGPLGWNIPYEFNESDLRISVRQLQMFLDGSPAGIVPFDALLYLTGECNYGGRVTDDWDRRTLNAILGKFINVHAIKQPNYAFSASGHYTVPATMTAATSYEGYLEHIRRLPLNQKPEAFGIHDNGDIARQLSDTKSLLDTIAKTQDNGGSGVAATRPGANAEDALTEIARSILARIPAPFDVAAVMRKYPVDYHESMNTVLIQELTRFNRLIILIATSLRNLLKATAGLILLTEELEDTGKNLMLGKVPTFWAAKSYPSLKPLASYIDDFVERIHFFQRWIDQGPPAVFWMSGFCLTQSFITATLQNYARRLAIPIDELTLEFEVLDITKASQGPDEGVYVSGLYLEAARWDPEARCIVDSLPSVLYNYLPLVHFKPLRRIMNAEGQPESAVPKKPSYTCPVYKTSARRGVLSTTGHSTNFVLPIQLPMDPSTTEEHWILRGVAALLQLD